MEEIHMNTELLPETRIMELLNVSRSAMQRFRRGTKNDPPIPFLRVGRRYLYQWDKVITWAERNARREKRM
jgi:hypothetical protein